MYLLLPKLNKSLSQLLRTFLNYTYAQPRQLNERYMNVRIRSIQNITTTHKHQLHLFSRGYLLNNPNIYFTLDQVYQPSCFVYIELFNNHSLRTQIHCKPISWTCVGDKYLDIQNAFNVIDSSINQTYINTPLNVSSFDTITTTEYFLSFYNDTVANYAMNLVLIDIDFTNTDKFERYSQEEVLLIYICYSVVRLCKDGNLVIKLPSEHFTELMCEITMLMSSLFQQTYIIHLNCDSGVEPTYFLICKSFQYTQDGVIFKEMIGLFQNICHKPDDKYVSSILNQNMPLYYRTKIDDILINMISEHIDVLCNFHNYVLNKQHSKESLIRGKQLNHTLKWLDMYNIPYTQK